MTLPETPVHLNHFCIIYELSTKKERNEKLETVKLLYVTEE